MRSLRQPTIPALLLALVVSACRPAHLRPEPVREHAWEEESPVKPLPVPPLGMEVDFSRTRVKLTPAKVRLGRWLFFDVRLSRDGSISCSTCHESDHAFSEPTPHSTGIGGQQGTRKAPPVVNVGFPLQEHYFWDGRAGSLVEQAKGPILNPIEMGNTEENLVRELSAIPGYRRAFRDVYGDERLDLDRVADAIAAYEATRISGGSAFDRFGAGDESALSAAAQEGQEIFYGRGRCSACHLGPNFTDSQFHNLGVGYEAKPGRFVEHGFPDPGRYAVTRNPSDIGAFKTPTLRDVSRRAPYMHDGSSPDLRDAILRYVRVQENPWLDPLMREVRITPADVEPLTAFLRSLDGTGYQDSPPRHFPQ